MTPVFKLSNILLTSTGLLTCSNDAELVEVFYVLVICVTLDWRFCINDILSLFTKLQSSFDLVQTRFPLSLITEPPTNGGEHFGLPGLYQQGIVVLLTQSNTHQNEVSTDFKFIWKSVLGD